MQNLQISTTGNRKDAFRRFAHLLAIGLIFLSSFGDSFYQASNQDNSSTPSPVQPADSAVQQISPPQSYTRPIFSRPEPKFVTRPEKPGSDTPVNSGAETVITQAALKEKLSPEKATIVPITPGAGTPTPNQAALNEKISPEKAAIVPITPGAGTPIPNQKELNAANLAQAQSSQSACLADIRGSWRFQDNSAPAQGYLQDSSSYGNNGVGNPANPPGYTYTYGAGVGLKDLSANPSLRDGSLGLARNGTELPVRLTNNQSSLAVSGTCKITLEAWVKIADYQTGFRHIIDNLNGYALSIKDGRPAVTLHGPVYWWTPNLPLLNPNQWYYIAATFDGVTDKIFINGQLRVSRAISVSVSAGTGLVSIGGIGSGESTYLFNGSIDEVRVTARAMSDAEILVNFNQYVTTNPAVFDNSVFNGDGSGSNCDCAESAQAAANLSIGDPINTRTGGVSEHIIDISLVTAAGPLSFERSYSSLATALYNTSLGYGWTHNLDTRLIFPGDPGGLGNSVLFKAHSANLYRFEIKSDGTYSPALGIVGDLSCSGATCILNLPNQESYTFLNHKLQNWEDGKGHSWTYTYNAVGGNLNLVTDDASAHYLSLSYDNQGRVILVSDSENRTVTFGYDSVTGDLSSITRMDGTWHYEYAAHRLTRVLDPANQVVTRNVYDTQGRAIQQYDGKGKLIIQLSYNSNGTTTITDANGSQSTHTYDARNTLTNQGEPLISTASKSYDPNFRPISITNPGQPATLMTWSTDGADLQYIKDPAGGETNITYLNHLPHILIDPNNFQTTYNYTGTLLTSVTYGFTPPQSYSYTYTAQAPVGLMESITDPLGKVTRYEYNTDGQRTKIIVNYDMGHGANEAGLYNLTSIFTYNNLGQLVTTTDSNNQVTKNIYDTVGRLTEVISNFNNYPTLSKNYQDSNGVYYNIITDYSYDLHGNQIAIINTLGAVTRSYFDANNRIVSVVQNLYITGNATSDIQSDISQVPAFDPAHTDRNIRTDTVYDDAGNMIATINPHGVVTRTYYDAAARQQHVVQNLLISGNAANDIISPFNQVPVYNVAYPDRNVRSDTVYDSSTGNAIASIDTYGKITRTYYDVMNRPVTVVENLNPSYGINTVTAPPRNSDSSVLTNLRTDMTYDVNGNTIATTDPLNLTTRTYYDALNRAIATVQNLNITGNHNVDILTPLDEIPAYNPAYPDRNVRSDTYYDSAGRNYLTVDPIGQVTRTYYDSAGRAVTVIRNLAQQYWNDSQAPAREAGNSDENLRTDTEYDAAGRRISTTDPRGLVTKFGYNAQGQLAYDLVNPLTGGDPNKYNLTTTFTYDALGRSLTTSDSLGRVTAVFYDALGRVTNTTKNVLVGGGLTEYNLTTTFSYNDVGQQIAQTDPLNMITRTYYDLLGRNVSTVRNLSGYTITDGTIPVRGPQSGTGSETNLRTDSVYDALGRLTSATNEIGKATTISYDALSRQSDVSDPLSNITHSDYDAGGRLIASTDANGTVTKYEYNAAGNLTAVIENALGLPAEQIRTEYTYDPNGNRLSIKDGNAHITHFTYDHAGRLKSETDPLGHIWQYGYDKNGNRTTILDANQKTTTYVYDLLNRLELIDYPAPDHDVSFAYDAAGRRTSMLDGIGTTTWHYDALDRPDSVTDPFNKTVSYTYNALGNRATLTYPGSASLPTGKVVTYAYDSAHRLNAALNDQTPLINYQLDTVSRIQSETLPNGVDSTYAYDDAGRLLSIVHSKGGQTLASYQYTEYDAAGNRKQVIEDVQQPGNQSFAPSQKITTSSKPASSPPSSNEAIASIPTVLSAENAVGASISIGPLAAATSTRTPTATKPTPTRTVTSTPVAPTSTRTRTITPTVPTPTRTRTVTATNPAFTSTPTRTSTATRTRTNTPFVPTLTPTRTVTPSRTVTQTRTPTSTATATVTSTATSSPTVTATATALPTVMVDQFSGPTLDPVWEWSSYLTVCK